MIDVFDIMAFVVFAVLIAAAFVIVVGLGMLPGWIAQRRGHPQAAAINVASWLGVATLGLLWPLALIWAFTQSSRAASEPAQAPASPHPGVTALQARIDALETALHQLQAEKEAHA